ncbi:hypothetical protein BC938DRAFT_484025 [Jimgerdemannia flammicorona]|uniref:Glycosyl hydrolase n=1 Tax=Jimgerdemannia flammicorona TaxID=994334 RepID=A0A433QAS3_9FUNG|nr:hypothetical protein BC938DRAFT_484025 [Jimgerdemannia flammicorona]
MYRNLLSASLALAFFVIVHTAIVPSPLNGKLHLSPNSLSLQVPFGYIISGYNEMPHHRRTPFAVAPNGNSYVAYLAASGDYVHVQQLDKNLTAVGTEVKVRGYEASGLVAHNDGFALLTSQNASTPNGETVATLVRVKGAAVAWTVPLNGPNFYDKGTGGTSSPVLDGDLAWNGEYYGAYFIVHGYAGGANGHYGDSIEYVDANGKVFESPYSNAWGCSHNEGIAIMQTNTLPFLTLCSNDWHTGIFLNTDTRSMSGPKISNDQTWAGYGGDPFGGEGGSFSNVAAFANGRYIVAWQTRGASKVVTDSGDSTVLDVTARWDVHNVAIAILKDKSTPLTTVPTKSGGAGDTNINWVTKTAIVDHVNVRVAAYGANQAVVTWEQVTSPKCNAGTCTGKFEATYIQLVDSNGAKVGTPLKTPATIGGDMRVMANGDIVWPYVDTKWDLSASIWDPSQIRTSKLSFARLSVA